MSITFLFNFLRWVYNKNLIDKVSFTRAKFYFKSELRVRYHEGIANFLPKLPMLHLTIFNIVGGGGIIPQDIFWNCEKYGQRLAWFFNCRKFSFGCFLKVSLKNHIPVPSYNCFVNVMPSEWVVMLKYMPTLKELRCVFLHSNMLLYVCILVSSMSSISIRNICNALRYTWRHNKITWLNFMILTFFEVLTVFPQGIEFSSPFLGFWSHCTANWV